MVQARGEILHPASEAIRIGEFAAAAFRELTGAEPAGWGIHEPVSEPWDTAELTRYCYQTAPMTSNIIVVGRPRPGTEVPSIGVLTVTRSATGVHESLELFCESVDPLAEDELASFGSAMHRAHARTALAGHAMLLEQLSFPARFTGVSVPGLRVLRTGGAAEQFGPQQALAAAGERARLVGVPPLQYARGHLPPRPLRRPPTSAGRVHRTGRQIGRRKVLTAAGTSGYRWHRTQRNRTRWPEVVPACQ